MRRLPPRLVAAADLVLAWAGREAVVAEVAAGRGELSLYLAANRLARRVIATDLSPKALQILGRLVEARGLGAAVELRCGDGLAALGPGEADVVVLAGVGGRLAAELLARGLPGLGPGGGPRVLVVQPMNQAAALRQWAQDQAGAECGQPYQWSGEHLVEQAGRYYHTFVLTARSMAPPWGPEAGAALRALYRPQVLDEVGPYLLAGPDPLLPGWIRSRLRSLERAREALPGPRPGAGPDRRLERRGIELDELRSALDAARLALEVAQLEAGAPADLRALLALQRLDQDLAAKQAALAHAQGRAGLAGAEAARAQAESLEAELARRVASIRRDLRYQEQEVEAMRADARARERQLYGDVARSPREAAQLEQHVISLRRRIGDAEDKVLSRLMELDSVTPELDGSRAALEQATQERDRLEGEIAAAQAGLEQELPGLRARRDQQAGAVRPDLLRQYEAARAKRAGPVVAVLAGGKCTACRMAVPLLMVREIRSGQLRTCESCRRILVEE